MSPGKKSFQLLRKALRENSPFRETRITMATGLKIPDAIASLENKPWRGL
jgi:hypothetical protein